MRVPYSSHSSVLEHKMHTEAKHWCEFREGAVGTLSNYDWSRGDKSRSGILQIEEAILEKILPILDLSWSL